MGARKFRVQTYSRFNYPVVEFTKRVLNEKGEPLKINPGGQNEFERGVNTTSIDIHKIDCSESRFSYLREIATNIKLEVIPEWINENNFHSKLDGILFEGEIPEDTLMLNCRLWCPDINYVIESKLVSLSDVRENKPILFDNINLDDCTGRIEMTSHLIRKKGTSKLEFNRTNSKLAVIAENASITFYIDAVEKIGGNFLNIIPADTGQHMFHFRNETVYGGQSPELEYHKDFERYFNNGDDYNSIKIMMIFLGPLYGDKLLRWVLFGTIDFENPKHKAIVSFLGELCERKESFFVKAVDEVDEKKIKYYFELSEALFKNIQVQNLNWRKFLEKMIKAEKE